MLHKRHNAIEMTKQQWEAEVERVLGEWTARGHKAFALEDVRAVLTQLNRSMAARSRRLLHTHCLLRSRRRLRTHCSC